MIEKKEIYAPNDIVPGQEEMARYMGMTLRNFQKNTGLFDCDWEKVRVNDCGRTMLGFTAQSMDILKHRHETQVRESKVENGRKGGQISALKMWSVFPPP